MQKKVVKTQLSIVDDVLNMVNKWDALYSDELKTRTQVLKIVAKYKQMDKEAASMYAKSRQLLKNAEKAAKELGVNESEIKGLDKLVDSMSPDVSDFARKEFKRL